MKKFLMALAVLALLAGGVKAADPDYTWREAVRAVIGTNGLKAGVIPASALNSNIVTNVLAEGMVMPAVDGSAVTNLDGANIASGNIAQERFTNSLATAGSKIGGNIPVAALTSSIPVKLTLNDGSGLTNMAAATAFPGYAVCVVTNLDVDGTTNIMTYPGTIAREQ